MKEPPILIDVRVFLLDRVGRLRNVAAVWCNALKRCGLATIATSLIDQAACSTGLKNPNVVLVVISSPDLFHRSKTAPAVDQFVPKRDFHFSIGMPGLPPDYQSVSFPSEARHRRGSLLSGNDFASI
jgi:hypothetical protein